MKKYSKMFIAVVALLALVFCESFWASNAIKAKAEDDFASLRDELAINVNSIDSAIKNGDQAQFLLSKSNFSIGNEKICANRFGGELCELSKPYLEELDANQGLILEIIMLQSENNKLRAMLASDSAEEITSENVASRLKTSAKNYLDFATSLRALDFSILGDERDALADFANGVARIATESAVCINVCTTDIFSEKEKALEELSNNLQISNSLKIDSTDLRKELNKE